MSNAVSDLTDTEAPLVLVTRPQPQADEWVQQLRALGVKLSVDDFGTGYSSLSYLHRLPVDTLKIDRSFIMNLHEDDKACHFVATIVHLAHKLGLDVICEGVELQVQANILKELKYQSSLELDPRTFERVRALIYQRAGISPLAAAVGFDFDPAALELSRKHLEPLRDKALAAIHAVTRRGNGRDRFGHERADEIRVCVFSVDAILAVQAVLTVDTVAARLTVLAVDAVPTIFPVSAWKARNPILTGIALLSLYRFTLFKSLDPG